MKKNFLLYLFICIVVLGCKRENDSPVSDAIEEKVSHGVGTIIDIAKLTAFEWDKLYIFGPYDNRDSIHDIVGIKFLKVNDIPAATVADYDKKDRCRIRYITEGFTFFVFVKEGKVVHYFLHSRDKGDFDHFLHSRSKGDSGGQYYEPITPDYAKFKVIDKGNIVLLENSS